MNIYESEIMNILGREPFVNQRILAEITGHSVGSVNKSLRQLSREGYLDDNMQLTDKARQEIRDKAPRNAIILAAGFGMRMVPINLTTPKALIEVNGEPLIERTIRQLHEAGVTDITVVVGFMKEAFEYLMDEWRRTASATHTSFRAISGAPQTPIRRWNPIPGTWSATPRTRTAQ